MGAADGVVNAVSSVLGKRASLPDQLAQDLRRRLRAGEWAEGQAIPAETALATAYAVSRNTIREATSRLVAEGRLRIQRGIGTLVNPPQATLPVPQAPMGMGLFQSLTEVIEKQGRTPRIELHRLERRAGTLEETTKLELPDGAKVLYAERAVYSNDDLLSYGYDRYPDSLFPDVLDEGWFSLSFVDIFKKLGVRTEQTHVEYHAVLSSTVGWGPRARKPRLYVMLDRLHRAAGGTPIFYAQTYCVEGRNQIYTTSMR
jgi:DNA-binding GntR family transcriptional regulator